MHTKLYSIKIFALFAVFFGTTQLNCSAGGTQPPTAAGALHHVASANSLAASKPTSGGSGSGSSADLKAATQHSPSAHPTQPSTPGGTPAPLFRINPIATHHGFDTNTNLTLHKVAAVLDKMVSGEKSDTVPTICGALNHAAAAIEKPGTIGFKADKETVEGIRQISANLKAISENINPRTCAAGAICYYAATTLIAQCPWCSPCLVAGSVEVLKPGTLKKGFNQTVLCCQAARQRVEFSTKCPFVKLKPVQPDAKKDRDA